MSTTAPSTAVVLVELAVNERDRLALAGFKVRLPLTIAAGPSTMSRPPTICAGCRALCGKVMSEELST